MRRAARAPRLRCGHTPEKARPAPGAGPAAGKPVVAPPTCFVKHLRCQSALEARIGIIRVFRPVSNPGVMTKRRPYKQPQQRAGTIAAKIIQSMPLCAAAKRTMKDKPRSMLRAKFLEARG